MLFPVSDSSASKTILLKSDTLPLTVTGVLLNCSQASCSLPKTAYPHLATELGFYLLTAHFIFSLYRFSKLHISYTHSVIFFSYVNTSFSTSIPRPSCAPHLSSSLILTQTLSCQLCHLFSLPLLFLSKLSNSWSHHCLFFFNQSSHQQAFLHFLFYPISVFSSFGG